MFFKPKRIGIGAVPQAAEFEKCTVLVEVDLYASLYTTGVRAQISLEVPGLYGIKV